MSKYGVISGLYFPVFGLNMEIYSVNLCIQSAYRKIWTRGNFVIGHFLRSDEFRQNLLKQTVAYCYCFFANFEPLIAQGGEL